jgi:hypothetical protein
MKALKFSLFSLMFLFIGHSYANGENTINVTFVNNSPKQLGCSIRNEAGYTPFIRLQPGKEKNIQNFKRGSAVRCHTEIEKTSSTVLTYFSVNSEGVYELLQELVPCKTCTNSKFRLATIVTFPNGEAFYNKYDM